MRKSKARMSKVRMTEVDDLTWIETRIVVDCGIAIAQDVVCMLTKAHCFHFLHYHTRHVDVWNAIQRKGKKPGDQGMLKRKRKHDDSHPPLPLPLPLLPLLPCLRQLVVGQEYVFF